MVWNLKLTSVAMFLLLTNGYGPSARRLDFVWNDTLTDEDMIRDAPIILIGKVNSVKLAGPVRVGILPLVRVRSTVENVIRGDVNTAKLDFYYYFPNYVFSGDTNSPVPEGRSSCS